MSEIVQKTLAKIFKVSSVPSVWPTFTQNYTKTQDCSFVADKCIPKNQSAAKLQISNLHYIYNITSKRVTSGGIHLHGLAPGQHSSEETSQRWQAVGNTVSDLTGPGIELPPR